MYYTNENGEYGIPERFRSALKETFTTESHERTEKNIKEADGILTLLVEEDGGSDNLKSSPGTVHGIEYAKKLGKREEQLCFVNLAKDDEKLETERQRVINWLMQQKVNKCAIGGPRESEAKGIQEKAYKFLLDTLRDYKEATNVYGS